MNNSQRAVARDDRAGTFWLRRWWSKESLAMRLFEIAFSLALGGATVWLGWYAPDHVANVWAPWILTIATITAGAYWARRSWGTRSR